MHHRSTVPLAPLVALILAAGGGAAQTTYTLSPFVSVDGALPGDPLLAGLSVERARGTIGMRAGAAFDLAGAGSAAADGRLGDAWTFDADLTLGLHRIPFLRGVLTGWAPRLSAGVGIAAGREADASRALVPVASWGFAAPGGTESVNNALAALRRRRKNQKPRPAATTTTSTASATTRATVVELEPPPAAPLPPDAGSLEASA